MPPDRIPRSSASPQDALIMPHFSARQGYLAGFALCAGLIAFALFLQYVKGEDPCPLCLLQRMAFIGLGGVFLLAALHNPGRGAAVFYAFVLALLAAAGGAIAGRQVWLQSLPKNMVPECGPGLDFILSRFPLRKALDLILRGSGECAEKGWTLLGLSIAGWSLVWFVLLGVLIVIVTIRRRREIDYRNRPMTNA
jgi:protein dithiol:quinone oxidoreductase